MKNFKMCFSDINLAVYLCLLHPYKRFICIQVLSNEYDLHILSENTKEIWPPQWLLHVFSFFESHRHLIFQF